MHTFRERLGTVLHKLMTRKNLSLDLTKLEQIQEYVNRSVEGCISPRVERHLNALESLSTIQNTQIQPLAEKINGQLGALINILKKEEPLTLISVISGLYTAFVSLLNPTLAISTTKKMKILSNSADRDSSTDCSTMQNSEYMKRYKLWIRPICEEKKQQFINELMRIPFRDALCDLKSKIKQDITSQMLIDKAEDIIYYLMSQASYYGFQGKQIEFIQYVRLITDFDFCTAFHNELTKYAKTLKPNSECTLTHFFQTNPSVRENIFVDECDMDQFVKQFNILFMKYCQQVRSKYSCVCQSNSCFTQAFVFIISAPTEETEHHCVERGDNRCEVKHQQIQEQNKGQNKVRKQLLSEKDNSFDLTTTINNYIVKKSGSLWIPPKWFRRFEKASK